MGLNVSHDAFSGAYSAFNRFRQMVAKAWGGSYPPHDDTVKYPDNGMWYAPRGASKESSPGLYAFLTSDDCEGSFTPSMAGKIADEMDALLPKIAELDDGGGGHIKRDGGYYAVAQKYIAGCRLAKSKRQKLKYG